MSSPTRRDFLLTGSAAAALSAGALPGSAAETGTQRTSAQPQATDNRYALQSKPWTANWIGVEGAPGGDIGVYHFRCNIELPAKPDRFVVHVSGDNRYQLYVNGHRVVWGPARGDLFHWRFETVDLAPYLESGRNALAAVVWNYADEAPEAQITLQTGFLLQGDTKAEQTADTGRNWKAIRNGGYGIIHFSYDALRGYYVAGPGEDIDGSRYPWGWETRDFDDSSWAAAKVIAPAAGADASDVHSRWMLVPRSIPLMEETPARIQRVRKSSGPAAPASWPAQPAAFEIPANTKATYLLDQTHLTTGYPELVVSGGKKATVTLRYAECLQIDGGRAKPNRNDVDGLDFIGYHDLFHPDGGQNRAFRPLWWRTWRYIEMDVETKDQPLRIEDLRAAYTGYPFERKSKLDTDDATLAAIRDVGWRTARLCAHETYMDCPYYEQLQYVGDTRIQSLISLYETGDARLVRNAISLINDSRVSNGATMSRYPTRLQQFIPSFSMWWIGMVHDYWRYVDDPSFVRAMLPGVRTVLSFFESHQKSNGSLGPLPWWRYMDWADEWKSGDAPQESDGSSAPFDLQLIMAYDWAADLEAALGMKPVSDIYRQRASALRTTAQQLYWDAGRRFYADTARKANWSQQTNTLAVLAGLPHGADAADLLLRTLNDRKLVQSSLYFRHYLYTAMNYVGEGDRYIAQLADWHAMIDNGLTTFSEVLDAPGRRSRSDCHAWSASPNYELLHTVLGVDSAAPHFSRVLVRPFLGKLTRASGSVPHPKGSVDVSLATRNGALDASVTLPPGISGELVWKGQRRDLRAGSNKLTVNG